MKDTVTLITKSPDETLAFGALVGARLWAGAIVALVGELGVGKTWFAKGVARGLEVPEHEYVTSPAYDLVHEYKGKLPVFHIDLYRIEEFSQSDRLWIEEYLYRNGVCVIEWADKIIESLAEEYLHVRIIAGVAPEERSFIISPRGPKYYRLLEDIDQWKSSSV